MSDYSVQQISKMLKTNPETVRRWIRSGKLSAVQDSRKSGNLVSEEALKSFIKSTPKYAGLITTLFAPTTFVLPIALGGLMGSVMAAIYGQKKSSITPDYVEKYLRKEIEQSKHSVETKKNAVIQLQAEINAEEKKIEQYKYVLENFDLETLVDEINKTTG